MSDTVIEVENLSKYYDLGLVGTGTLSHDLLRTLAKLRGKPDPTLKIGQKENNNVNGHIWALRDISFEVKQGEVLGIIGRNGAGKSTLLKILSRVTAPTTGECRIKGRIASLLEVGTGFHPELTGRENTFLNGAILGMTRQEIRKKFDEIVAFAEVEKFINTPVKRYSSGMYVRLAFAVAAHLEPEILLVDEVLAVGDMAFQKKCLGKMGQVADRGRTVLFVSHNMAAVQALCTRGILLNMGQVIVNSDIKTTMDEYMNTIGNIVNSVSLLDRNDRVGGDKFKFESVEFLDTRTGATVDSAVSGQAITIRLAFTNSSCSLLNNVNIGIAFSSFAGQMLCGCGSQAVGKLFTIEPGRGSISCHIPRWPLNFGRYYYTVNANCGNDGLDFIKDAGFIDVIQGDFYGTGKIPASKSQGVFIEYMYSKN